MIFVADIQRLVAEDFGLTRADILCESRKAKYARPRHAAMYLSRRLTKQSLNRLGDFFGGRDHTTIIAALRSIERHMEKDPNLALKVEARGLLLQCQPEVRA